MFIEVAVWRMWRRNIKEMNMDVQKDALKGASKD